MSEQKIKIESLRFEGVQFKFEGQDSILNRTDFEFPVGEIVWIKSTEGAGKSTVLQVLAGLEIPQSGKYLINQNNVTDMSFEEFLPYRLNIGYSFDYGGLISNRTVFDNLMLPLVYHRLLPFNQAKKRVTEILEKFDIQGLANERPAHIPGRVRKLTCLLRAVITEPQMILMDDPSVGLSQSALETFVEHVHELREKGHCQHTFISSYDEQFMNLFNYQLVHLDAGSLYYEAVDPAKKVMHL